MDSFSALFQNRSAVVSPGCSGCSIVLCPSCCGRGGFLVCLASVSCFDCTGRAMELKSAVVK